MAYAHRSKRVIQLDMQDNIIAAYNSMREAERITSAGKNRIKDACEDPRKTAGGFKWRFVD